MIERISPGVYKAECDWIECDEVLTIEAPLKDNAYGRLRHHDWKRGGKGAGTSTKVFCPKHMRRRKRNLR